MDNNAHFIQLNQLRVGLFVHLDLGWMDHPFTTSNFKIKDHTQIEKIKHIGLNKLRYDPNRSDCAPLPLEEKKVTSSTEQRTPKKEALVLETTEEDTTEAEQPSATCRPEISKRVTALNESIQASEKKFLVASQVVKDINQNMAEAPKSTLKEASKVINDLLDTTLMEGDVVMHAMASNRVSDSHFEHALNVTVLALLLAKSLDFSKDNLRLLGLAAIMHDIGKSEISDAVLKQKGGRSQQAIAHYRQHVEFGHQMIKKSGAPARVGRMIGEHHEYADGSGYPQGITVNALDPLSNIIIICNHFDDLCNPVDVMQAKTPYEALRFMFANQRGKFHEAFLKHFIKSIGVYPPNSIIKLSNGEYGSVISVNPNQPLKPFVRLLTDTMDENDVSSIIDLRAESSISITACIKHAALPNSIARLIRPHQRKAYFIDNEKSEIKQ